MVGILALPTELLQQIACLLSCSDILRLRETHRRLNDACHDRRVYAQIAKDYLWTGGTGVLDKFGSPPVSEVSQTQHSHHWSEGDLILKHASLGETQKIALAVELGVEAAHEIGVEWLYGKANESKSKLWSWEVIKWLPRLLAFHHPAGYNLSPTTFFRVQSKYNVQGANESEVRSSRWFLLNLVITCLALSRLSSGDYSHGALALQFALSRSLESLSDPNPQMNQQQNESGIDERSMHIGLDMFTSLSTYKTFQNTFSLNDALSILPAMIAAYDAEGDMDTGIFPRPRKIRFTDIMYLPDMFAEDLSLGTFPLQKMIATVSLSGKWRGIYSDHQFVDSNSFAIDPPMQDIEFVYSTVPRTGNNVAILIDKSSRGSDSNGDFTLEGWIEEDGSIWARKTYTGSQYSRIWFGQLTPFGIVAVYGFPGFGGYVWIWKEEWC